MVPFHKFQKPGKLLNQRFEEVSNDQNMTKGLNRVEPAFAGSEELQNCSILIKPGSLVVSFAELKYTN